MRRSDRRFHLRLMAGAAIVAITGGAASAEQAKFNIPPQPLSAALNAVGVQSHHAVLFTPEITAAKTSPGVTGALDTEVALNQVLAGSGLTYRKNGETYLIVSGESEGGNVVQELVVTAQRKEEAIQTVPIAISAFTQKSLEEQHIEGGFDLLKAIPNVTFSKNNFTSYNFSIRGIGTKAVSVTTDPGVAVEFNSTAFIRNRLFEQEYFDIERVEVLRGPQGTLHGRNATAGVINVISAKPNLTEFSGSLKAEVGNYDAKRVSAMLNVPLIGDKLAIRFAGAFTDRSGYDYNSVTKHQINGRDLWSARMTVAYQPTARLHAELVWEHFNEDDDRSRTGKQLCHRDDGAVTEKAGVILNAAQRGAYSQGCLPGSLYDAGAFDTPNGYSIPFIQVGADDNTGIGLSRGQVIHVVDPYGGLKQSPDLRTIASVVDPKYRAKTDIVEFNIQYNLTDRLTLTSQTGYDKDFVYSIQDYNRFNSFPVFRNTSDPADFPPVSPSRSTSWDCFIKTYPGRECVDFRGFAPGGVFNDPQIGPSNTIAGLDLSTSRSTQFSQEFRMESSFSGRFNFSAGANYLRYRTIEDYYVFFNLLTALTESLLNGSGDYIHCPNPNQFFAVFNYSPDTPVDSPGCGYIDPNPIGSINGDGHNYFRSKNPYRLQSASAFGEAYWQIRDDLKLTAGLRYTDDHKTFTPVPSQVLLSSESLVGGFADRGYPSLPDIKQHWGEFTGRLGLDWKPDLRFTDQTMVYGFYSRGYKGGGANPPGIGFRTEPVDICKQAGAPCQLLIAAPLQTLPYPLLFEPEFVNAFEVGAKNTLLGGALVLNGDVFYYDYSNYQVSQIKDRTAVNENFDAKVWGLELETLFQPTRNLRINGSLGYQDSSIADGAKSIDLMDRTQGNTDWVVVKPWVQLPSNCVIPRWVAESDLSPNRFCAGSAVSAQPDWLAQLQTAANDGQGFYADLGGNKLPNAPHWTISTGAQYSMDVLEGWRATLRGDAYWQSQSWARVYNDDPYDKLHGWYNVNLSLWIEKPDVGLKIEIYAKNLLNKTPITDAFLNSDDSALTTNVFVLDPRLIGFSITKTF